MYVDYFQIKASTCFLEFKYLKNKQKSSSLLTSFCMVMKRGLGDKLVLVIYLLLVERFQGEDICKRTGLLEVFAAQIDTLPSQGEIEIGLDRISLLAVIIRGVLRRLK